MNPNLILMACDALKYGLFIVNCAFELVSWKNTCGTCRTTFLVHLAVGYPRFNLYARQVLFFHYFSCPFCTFFLRSNQFLWLQNKPERTLMPTPCLIAWSVKPTMRRFVVETAFCSKRKSFWSWHERLSNACFLTKTWWCWSRRHQILKPSRNQQTTPQQDMQATLLELQAFLKLGIAKLNSCSKNNGINYQIPC